MAYVHGHPRDTSWVVAHYRRPQDPDVGQLELPLPAPRPPSDDGAPRPPAPDGRDRRAALGSRPRRS